MPRRKAVAVKQREWEVPAVAPPGLVARVDALCDGYGAKLLDLHRQAVGTAFAELARQQQELLAAWRAFLALSPAPRNQRDYLRLGADAAIESFGLAVQVQAELGQAFCAALGADDPPMAPRPTFVERRFQSVVIKFPDRRAKS